MCVCPSFQIFNSCFHSVTSIRLLACSHKGCNLFVRQFVKLVFQPCNIANGSAQKRIIPRRSFPQKRDLTVCMASVKVIRFMAFFKPFCKNRQQIVNVLYSTGQLSIVYIVQVHTVNPLTSCRCTSSPRCRSGTTQKTGQGTENGT
nr:MAG TPA: hypothetical protein [Caudoviricetes sp.]